MVKEDDVIVVWFSCGGNSAVAAKIAVSKYGRDRVRICNNPIAEEHPDNRRFLEDVQEWVGVPIESVTHPDYPNHSAVEVWEKSKAMSFPEGAPCTRILKREARQHWEKSNKFDHIVLGFSLDEKKRYENFILTERSNVLPLLIDAGMTKQDCHDYLVSSGIRPPVIYEMGYPNANCIGCPKATSPTYWNAVRRDFPSVFNDRAEISRRLGVRLVRVKGERIFLDELDPLARGNRLKSLKPPECGIFCEERLDV